MNWDQKNKIGDTYTLLLYYTSESRSSSPFKPDINFAWSTENDKVGKKLYMKFMLRVVKTSISDSFKITVSNYQLNVRFLGHKCVHMYWSTKIRINWYYELKNIELIFKLLIMFFKIILNMNLKH